MHYELRWVDEQARDRFLALKTSTKDDQKLYKSIERTFEKLKYNPFKGESIKKERIPPEYRHLNNLFKMNINQYWRLLYTVKSLDRSDTLIIILDFLPHNEYDRLFGYN
jgi:Txe/YoeB family toxin of Txe-Axe toxin-antitoxin module